MRETVSLDELRLMVHMSKRRVAYLLNAGLIPCEILPRATHRYIIRREDADSFAQDYALHPEKYQTASASFSSVQCPTVPEHFDSERFRTHLTVRWRDLPDILAAPDVATLTGYNENTARRWMKEERLRSVWLLDDRITTTTWLIDFLATGYGATIATKSLEHRELMRLK